MSKYAFDVEKYIKDLAEIISEILSFKELSKKDLEKILKRHPKDGREIFSKDQLVAGIDFFMSNESNFTGEDLLKVKDQIKMKPIRTISGVTTVTVLTKPFPCPGECIFCPNDVRMPKSYIATEPGAQRALANRFSPYLQTWNRLQALKNIGHPTEKIELLVLGGTWSSYSEEYQIWFISECFRAMNDFSCDVMVSLSNHEETNEDVSFDRPKMTSQGRVDHTIRSYNIDESGFKSEGEKLQIQKYLESDWNNELREKVGELPYNKLVFTKEFKEDFAQYICSDESALPRKQGWTELEKLHKINSTSKTKCVGLVLETRPDEINEEEALRLRKLGATKIQLGIQTLNDDISKANKRGEGGRETSRAFNLLRMAGFKIHAHIMPNLYKATPELDKQSYQDLFSDENYKPDEVKIYPTSVIKFTELYNLYEQGEYKPYETETLVDLIADMMEMTPEYCRLTRIIRDIPSTEIEAGNKTTNLREVVEWKLAQEGRANPNIRAREIKDNLPAMLRIALQAGSLNIEKILTLDTIEFETKYTTEYFLQYITEKREIAGFLRLSMPKDKHNPITDELNDCAMIREIHVYGPSLELKKDSKGEAQHLGLGTKLIEKAKEIAKENGFSKLAVISAIGTREYYKKRGFELDKYYQIANV